MRSPRPQLTCEGEQGRGFAVVADEVRTLVSRTQQPTQEIQRMTEDLRKLSGGLKSLLNQCFR